MIKEIFFNEIIPACANGTLQINDLFINIKFYTKIPEINYFSKQDNTKEVFPCLIINDVDKFSKNLEVYVTKALDFYFNGIKSYENIKSVLSYLFANATEDDLINPITFLNKQINFLEWKPIFNKNDNLFLGYNSSVIVSKNNINLETPYCFKLRVFDEKEDYFLPTILFGISNDTAFIYAIQNRDTYDSKLRKVINRRLYELNANFENYEDGFMNPKDVTMSFVTILIVFIRYLTGIGISKIKLPLVLPIRYNNHFQASKKKIEFYKKTLSQEDFSNKLKEIEVLDESYAKNVTLKLYRTFYRVQLQGDVLIPNSFPFQSRDGIEFIINKDGVFNNELAASIFMNDSRKK